MSYRVKRTLVSPREKCNIEIFPDGIRMTTPKIANPDGKGGGQRGEVKGFSSASRRRLRQFLLTNRLPEAWPTCACTYTIPGYTLPREQTDRLWKNFQTNARREGVACVWRKEVQTRGQLHWHAIAGVEGKPEAVKELLERLWHRALKSLGKIEYYHVGPVLDPVECDFVTGRRNIMDWKGADKYSARVDICKDQTAAWKRYMHDHTTKSKREQVTDFGRSWGVIARKAFETVTATEETSMDWKTYCKVLRAYNRMCTPYIRDDSAMFSRRRGFTALRGKIGSSIYFCRPDTMLRLIEWATV